MIPKPERTQMWEINLSAREPQKKTCKDSEGRAEWIFKQQVWRAHAMRLQKSGSDNIYVPGKDTNAYC